MLGVWVARNHSEMAYERRGRRVVVSLYHPSKVKCTDEAVLNEMRTFPT